MPETGVSARQFENRRTVYHDRRSESGRRHRQESRRALLSGHCPIACPIAVAAKLTTDRRRRMIQVTGKAETRVLLGRELSEFSGEDLQGY